METQFKSFFPPKEKIQKLFWVILAFTNFVAFLGFAYNVEAFALRFTIFHMMVILAYVLVYALFEASIVLLLLAILGAILPKTWLYSDFLFKGTLIYFLGTLLLYPWIGFTSRFGINYFYIPVNSIPQKSLFITLWLLMFAMVLVLVHRVFRNCSNKSRFINFLSRISVLSKMYFVFDIIAAITVVFRILQ